MSPCMLESFRFDMRQGCNNIPAFAIAILDSWQKCEDSQSRFNTIAHVMFGLRFHDIHMSKSGKVRWVVDTMCLILRAGGAHI